MKEELDPLEDDVKAVLGALAPVVAVPHGAEGRIWRAVRARVAMTGTGVETPTPGFRGWVARNAFVALGMAAACGGIVGAIARGGPEVKVVEVVTPATPAPTAASTAPWQTVPSSTSLPSEPVSAPPKPKAPPASSLGSADSLAAESALLDVARTAIARGEAAPALDAVERHARTFPNGMLREEREALAVKALLLAGRRDEARARADKLRARYPDSLFLPALESSFGSDGGA